MKKYLISLALALAVLFGGYFLREPIIDFLPIDQSGWVEREGQWYLLDEDGDPRSGWVDTEQGRFFFNTDGAMRTGWLDQGDFRFYLNEDGTMHTGWLELEGNTYFFGENGEMVTGLFEQDGKRYHFSADGNPETGFFPAAGQNCYINADGSIQSGWLEMPEGRYYLNHGMVHIGWLEEGEHRFFLNDRGLMATGWTETEEGTFYLKEDGTLATGWVEIDGSRYCFDENGRPYSGWAEVDGKKGYFHEDGTVYTGWLEENGKRYYIRQDGTMAVGKVEIDGEGYFFSSAGVNFIMVNPWHDLPEGFEVELVQAENARLDPVCQEALSKMLADCRAAGFRPMVKSSYRSIADQRANLQRMIKNYQDQGYGYNQAYSAATKIVAVPGTSEHHLGLAFDIVDSAYTNLNHQQATRPTQKWLMEHCWEYGFILRYPENSTDITGIIWEPWHYRYVGVEMATEIRDLGCITLETYIDNLTNDGTTCGGKLVVLE